MTKIAFDMFKSGNSAHRTRETAEDSAKQTDHALGLLDAWVLLKRRSWLIATIVLSCTLLAAIASFVAPKTYTARSAVVLERKDIRPFATDASLQSLDRDRSAAETEMDVLRSRQFVGRVVDKLNLTDNPIFNPTLRQAEETKGAANYILRYVARIAGILQDSNPSTTPPAKQIQRDRAISILLNKFDVNRTGESLAVEIKVLSDKAELAATIANTIARLYVESSIEFKQDERIADKKRALSTRGAVGFLRQSITQPLLVTLRAEEARLQQTRDELASKYGKNHPQIVEADAQLASVQSMIDNEVQRIILDLEAESLKPSARILSSAEIPTSPSFPKPRLIIPAAFAGSALLALLLAVLLEASDTRIRSGRRTAQLLQIPNLGYIPQFSKNRQQSAFTEAERSVYMACRYTNVGKLNSVVMITSCLHGKASSSMAWGLAASAAADGRSTMLIELDFHEQDASDLDGTEHSRALVDDYLRDETFLVEVIRSVPNVPRLGFIDAARVLHEPSRPLSSKRFRELLAAIKKTGYDFTVLHAPPVLVAGDANWLAPLVDGVILSATWGKTTEDQLLDAAAQLRMNRAPLIGTVIDQVNPRIHVRHRYGGAVLTGEPNLPGSMQRISSNGGIPI